VNDDSPSRRADVRVVAGMVKGAVDMAIVGISGSPIVKGNTDRMTQAILAETGKETRFVNLSTLNFSPCRACAHNCATTAMCGVKDDLHPCLSAIRDAEALVLSTSIHHGTMTAWMYSFFSRLWCFLHENKILRRKPVLLVSCGIDEMSEAGDPFDLSLVKEHAFKLLGRIYFQSLTPPCFKCGKGEVCRRGGLWRMVGRDLDALKEFAITPDKFRRWEDCPETVDEIKTCGKMLSEI
jgi:NAD(P)H-dependent FMN reductase